MTLTLRRLALILGFAQCIFCAGVSAQGLGSGNGTATPSARDYTEEARYGPIRKIGGNVTSPIVTTQPAPEYSDEAREKKFNGVVLVGLIVDKDGMPQEVHIVRGVGMGLDENSVATVRQYRFKPATENGNPVAVRMMVEISYNIFDQKDAAAFAARRRAAAAQTPSQSKP